MTQYVVIEKDGIQAEVLKEAADDVWVPVMGWSIVGEPTDAPTKDPWAPAESAESAPEEAAPAEPAAPEAPAS